MKTPYSRRCVSHILGPVIMASAISVCSVRAEVFFSEYVEGTGNNKALELFNYSLTNVDLSTYQIRQYNNGATTPTYTFTLSGTLEANSTYIMCNSAATSSLVNIADFSHANLNFNGNDTISLSVGSTVLDVIGQIGNNPPVGYWGSTLTNTLDHTLVRMPSIVTGDANGTDAFNPATEWIPYPVNTFSYLGSHTVDVSPVPEPGSAMLVGFGGLLVLVVRQRTSRRAGPSLEAGPAFGGPIASSNSGASCSQVSPGATVSGSVDI
jgi:predicted extracellular nuclease